MNQPIQILVNDFTKRLRQDHAALTAALFLNPEKPAADIDIVNIDHPQGCGPQSQGSQKQDDDKISEAKKIVGPGAEIPDEPVVLSLSQKLGNGFFDLGIWQPGGDIFRNLVIEC